MSKLNVDNIENRLGTGGPQLPGATFTDDIVGTAASFTGIVTATTFDGNLSGNVTGNLTGNVTGNVTGTAGGLTGTPDITVGSVTGTTGTFSGDVSIGGTLTYEDVTNVDSVGLVTARTGVRVTSGGLVVTGIATFNDNIVGDNATNISGINSVTATAFYGDGSNITGISDPNKSTGVSTVTTSTDSSGDVIVIMDVNSAQSFTYTVPSSSQIGVLKFTNVPITSGTPSVTTVTLKVTQNAEADANRLVTYQLGQLCSIVPSGGSEITPIRGLSDGLLTLSQYASSENAFTYKIFYNGGSTSSASSYDIIGEGVTNEIGIGITDLSIYSIGRKVVAFSDQYGFIPSMTSDTVSSVNAGFTTDGKIGGFYGPTLSTVKYPSGEVIDSQATGDTQVYGGQIHPSGQSFVTSTNSSPYVKAWALSNGVFGSQFSDPSSLPSSEGRHAKFSPDGNHVAVVSTTSPRLQAYPWSNSTGFGAKYSNPSSLNGSAFSLAWHPDGNAVAFCCNVSPYVQAFSFTGSGFGIRYSNPSTAITGSPPLPNAECVAWSPSGDDIAIVHNATPFVSVYPWTSGSGFGTKYSDGSGLGGTGTFVSWSVTGRTIFLGRTSGLTKAVQFTHNNSGGSNGGFGSQFTIPDEIINQSSNYDTIFAVPGSTR